jgi:hypothetical protein
VVQRPRAWYKTEAWQEAVAKQRTSLQPIVEERASMLMIRGTLSTMQHEKEKWDASVAGKNSTPDAIHAKTLDLENAKSRLAKLQHDIQLKEAALLVVKDSRATAVKTEEKMRMEMARLEASKKRFRSLIGEVYNAMATATANVRTMYNNGVLPAPDAQIKDDQGVLIQTYKDAKELYLERVDSAAEKRVDSISKRRKEGGAGPSSKAVAKKPKVKTLPQTFGNDGRAEAHVHLHPSVADRVKAKCQPRIRRPQRHMGLCERRMHDVTLCSVPAPVPCPRPDALGGYAHGPSIDRVLSVEHLARGRWRMCGQSQLES